MTPDAVVIGAGVVGLTTGICLAEAGINVLILTAHKPSATTSVLATAMVGPTFGRGGPRAQEWEAVTLREVIGPPIPPGVHLCRGRFVARVAEGVPPNTKGLPGFKVCTAAELPDGYKSGFWAEVPLISMPLYVDHLVERFSAAGGELEIRRIERLSEAAALARRVANCSGLGARDLVPDSGVVPLRGPRIVVENPGLDTFLIDGPPGPEFTSLHPHGDTVVLGGSARVSADTAPDPDEATAIMARAAAVEPRLHGARLLEHSVGLRPSRPEVRLEAEQLERSTIVHNYGHAGVGVTLAWGCARDAAQLLMR